MFCLCPEFFSASLFVCPPPASLLSLPTPAISPLCSLPALLKSSGEILRCRLCRFGVVLFLTPPYSNCRVFPAGSGSSDVSSCVILFTFLWTEIYRCCGGCVHVPHPLYCVCVYCTHFTVCMCHTPCTVCVRAPHPLHHVFTCTTPPALCMCVLHHTPCVMGVCTIRPGELKVCLVLCRFVRCSSPTSKSPPTTARRRWPTTKLV